MSERNQEFDSRDFNKDGKVSFDEALKSAADSIREGAEEVVGKVRAYADLSPEERKAKNEELKEKASQLADEAAATAKEVFEEMKENAGKLFKKGE